jgi:hypothetical protein
MTTLNELTYRILALYREQYKDSDSLSERLVQDWIHSARAMLIKQKLDKPMSTIDENIVQDLGEIEMESVDSSIIAGVGSDRYMLRTKLDLPATIERSGHIGTYTRIGPADRLEMRFKPVSFETALTSGFGKFNNRDVFAFLIGAKIYLISREINSFKHIEHLDVRGVFQNPVEAARFKKPSYTFDEPYPINKNMTDQLEELILKSKLSIKKIGLMDNVANQTDDIVNQQQTRK